MSRTKLISLGVKIFLSSGGCCRNSFKTTAYLLPIKLHPNIIPFLEEFGNSHLFEKTGLLKIDNKDFAITGVRNISQIRFIIKNKEINNIDRFEEKLCEYIEWFNRKDTE